MLFKKNKYSYLDLTITYIKLVPGMAIMKIIYNIINRRYGNGEEQHLPE